MAKKSSKTTAPVTPPPAPASHVYDPETATAADLKAIQAEYNELKALGDGRNADQTARMEALKGWGRAIAARLKAEAKVAPAAVTPKGPTEADIRALAEEMNAVMDLDPALDHTQDDLDALQNQMLAELKDLRPGDFWPQPDQPEGKVQFSEEAAATIQGLGVTLPERPKVSKAPKAPKAPKVRERDRVEVICQVLKNADGWTKEQVIKAADVEWEKHGGETGKKFGGAVRCTLKALTFFGILIRAGKAYTFSGQA